MTNQADRSGRPFDPGLQPERTALAWTRTSLALAVGALICMRVLPLMLGSWAAIPAAAGLVAAIGVFLASRRRYVRTHGLLTAADHDRIPLHDGRLPAVVASIAIAGGLLIMLAVVCAAAVARY